MWLDAPDARALCETLLCATPAARPSPRVVLAHPWLVSAPQRDRRINLSLRYLGRVASLRDVCFRCLESCMTAAYTAELRSHFDALDSDAKVTGGDGRLQRLHLLHLFHPPLTPTPR